MLRRRLRCLGFSLLYGELGLGTIVLAVGGVQAHPMLFYLGALLAALAVVALAGVAAMHPGGS